MRKYRSSAVALITSAVACVVVSIFAQGCAKASEVTATPDGGAAGACNPKLCLEKNVCLNDGKETKCQLPCATQDECGFNYTCKQLEGAEAPFCVKDNVEYAKGAGQWGTPCNPKGGFDQNPDCDSAQNFWCYGETPTDAHAFCTQYQCQTDGDCRGGYHCAKVNKAPNVVNLKRSERLTVTVCLPRTYCAPCATNLDCPTLPNGNPQYCVADATGQAKFCTGTCTRDANCNLEAKCVMNEELGAGVCTPRAGVCKGDGTVCSPCTSDDDCTDGLCMKASYATERFCGATSKITCEIVNEALKAECPKAPTGAPYRVGCSTSDDPDFPKNQCIGIVDFGGNPNVGCWTKKR